MATKSKHIQQRQQEAIDIKQQVVDLLQWQETAEYSQYGEYQYNCGLDYLNYFLDGDAIGIDYLERRADFWNWWKNKWTERDKALLEQGNGAWRLVKHSTLVELYRQRHDPYELSNGLKPHAVVLGKGFCKLYHEKQIMVPETPNTAKIK